MSTTERLVEQDFSDEPLIPPEVVAQLEADKAAEEPVVPVEAPVAPSETSPTETTETPPSKNLIDLDSEEGKRLLQSEMDKRATTRLQSLQVENQRHLQEAERRQREQIERESSDRRWAQMDEEEKGAFAVQQETDKRARDRFRGELEPQVRQQAEAQVRYENELTIMSGVLSDTVTQESPLTETERGLIGQGAQQGMGSWLQALVQVRDGRHSNGRSAEIERKATERAEILVREKLQQDAEREAPEAGRPTGSATNSEEEFMVAYASGRSSDHARALKIQKAKGIL